LKKFKSTFGSINVTQWLASYILSNILSLLLDIDVALHWLLLNGSPFNAAFNAFNLIAIFINLLSAFVNLVPNPVLYESPKNTDGTPDIFPLNITPDGISSIFDGIFLTSLFISKKVIWAYSIPSFTSLE